MVTNTPSSKPSSERKRIHYLRWIVIVMGAIALVDIATTLLAEGFWFQEVDFLRVFQIRLQTQGGLALVGFGISAGVLLVNQAIARRLAWSTADSANAPPLPARMGIVRLLPLSFGLSLILGMMVIYYGQIAISHWHPNLRLYQASSTIPANFRPASILQIGQTLQDQPWQLGVLIASAIALLIYPQFLLRAIAVLMSVGFGLVMSEQWDKLLLFLSPTDFENSDPLFGNDVSFYIFQLPIWEVLNFWLIGLAIWILASVSLIYLLSGNSLSQGHFPGFSPDQQRHLHGLGGGLMLTVALSYWLDRYELLYSPQGVTFGASYTNVVAQLPAYSILSVAALIIGVVLIWRAIVWRRSRILAQTGDRLRPSSLDLTPDQNATYRSPKSRRLSSSVLSRTRNLDNSSPSSGSSTRTTFRESFYGDRRPSNGDANGRSGNGRSGNGRTRVSSTSESASLARSAPPLRPIVSALIAYVLAAAIAGLVLPALVQRIIVQPNELERERPYIEHSIALTRDAFDLSDIEVETFNPQTTLTYEELQQNDLTVNNIRLWDTRPLLETNRQLQRIRLYYEFPDADIDRYTLKSSADSEPERRQVLIAARELDYSAVPEEAKTWVNRHLIYTHGYGFTMSPVNTAGPGGLPDYFIRGIEHVASNDAIQESIPVGQPRIYYGEMTDNYVMTRTRVRELDFPSGSDNVYNTYDGNGGISIGAYWRRLLFAKHLKDWRMLFTEDFTPDTRFLFRRTIADRVRAIAPFLRYDTDPYLVVADTGQSRNRSGSNNYLYWIIDAYITSDRYPYSDPNGNDFNYIRNSVKVLIDAYHGSVTFYVADPSDPIIQSWNKIFPNMLHPLSDMPDTLREHIRYPQDYYQVQSDQLMTYHMTDPQVFYNREDKWRAPSEIYASEQQQVKPYYLLMRLPNAETGEFILLRPFTPAQRRNLIAWLAARSDGQQYGSMLLYSFPKQELVYGPEQVEARINQDPIISQQISLWNRQGSRAIQGNLLVIPIEQSLLYVEPLYLEAEQNRLPTLVRVIVAYENRIAMAPSLSEALRGVFQAEGENTTTIIRPVEEELIAPLNEPPGTEAPETEGGTVDGTLENQVEGEIPSPQ
ncbi:MAG TPA: UPF0182 family protein [Elainellaceae cyanobacterium]